MSINIKYSNKGKISSVNNILFCNEKFNVAGLKKDLTNSEFKYIQDLLRTHDLKKNLYVFELTSKKKIILISIKNNLKVSDIENLGGEFFNRINYGEKSEYFLNSDTIFSKHKNFLSHFLHGLKLKSYEFKKYKTKKNLKNISIIVTGKNKPSTSSQLKFRALEEGTFLQEI